MGGGGGGWWWWWVVVVGVEGENRDSLALVNKKNKSFNVSLARYVPWKWCCIITLNISVICRANYDNSDKE